MKRIPLAACAVALTVSGLVPFGLSPAAAETASTGRAQGYGANVNLVDTPAVNRAGLAEITLPPGGVAGPEELALVPVAPVLVDGLAAGLAGASAQSTLTTTLAQTRQAVDGPYNLVGVGLLNGLDVLAGTPSPVPPLPDLAVSLVSADAVRGEAVGVCRAGRAEYAAESEILDFRIGGTPVVDNATVEDLVDTLNTLLEPLAFAADIETNVVTRTADGISIDALRVTVLGAIGDPTAPVLDLVVGHAEVSGLQCAPRPQCSDTMDNDGDGKIDAQDPGCINNGVYDPNDDDERDLPVTAAVPQRELPRTGADLTATAPIAVGLSVLALVALALRRRSQV